MALDVQEILLNPREWAPMSREDAIRHHGSGRVVVVYDNMGHRIAAAFGPDSPFFLSGGPYDYPGLRYFAKVGAASVMAQGRPRLGPNSTKPKEEAEEEDNVPLLDEAESEEAVESKGPAEIKLVKLDAACFAPAVETLQLQFEVTGDLAMVESIHLRVASEKTPDVFWVDRKLDIPPKASGTYDWDGSVDGESLGGFINLEQSPYLVQLGITPKGGAAKYTNKCKVKVELLETQICVGDDLDLGVEEKDKDTLAALKKELKKTGTKGRILIDSPVFKINSAEMTTGASHDEYEKFAGKGPGIPLFVNLWLKGKGGGKKRSPRAVHGTRIVWDCLPDDEPNFDVNLSDRGMTAEVKTFYKKASQYECGESNPTGWSSHLFVGGMRGKSKERGEAQKHWKALTGNWGLDDPDNRTWAGFTTCKVSAESDSDSGVIFHGGRMAGDRHWVTALADLQGKLDQADVKAFKGTPAECRSKTLTLQNWRDIKVTKSYLAGGAIPLDFANTNKEFNKAGISITNKAGLVDTDITDSYKSQYKTLITAWKKNNEFLRCAAEDDSGDYPMRYRSYDEFMKRVEASTASAAGVTDKVAARTKATTMGAGNLNGYRSKCQEYALDVVFEIAGKCPVGDDGLTVFHFGGLGVSNERMKGDGYFQGVAPFLNNFSTRNKAVLFIFWPGNLDHLVIHEMAHNFFLNHAPGHWVEGWNPDGYSTLFHDEKMRCIMSYHPDKKFLCGYCLVKLAGWDPDGIMPDGTFSTMENMLE